MAKTRRPCGKSVVISSLEMANPSGDSLSQNPGMHSNVIKESVTDNDHTTPNVSANSVPALMDKSVP